MALCACTRLFTSLKYLCVALAMVPTISPPPVRPPDFNSSGLCHINNGGKKETELLQGCTPDREWFISQSGMDRKRVTKAKRVEIYVEYDR